MEDQVLEIERLTDACESTVSGQNQLSELQLLLVGGGCAEVCPY